MNTRFDKAKNQLKADVLKHYGEDKGWKMWNRIDHLKPIYILDHFPELKATLPTARINELQVISDEGAGIEQPKSYTELIKAIGGDITPRIADFCKITSLTEAIDEALNAGPTLELIALFVGWRHRELIIEEREQRPCQEL